MIRLRALPALLTALFLAGCVTTQQPAGQISASGHAVPEATSKPAAPLEAAPAVKPKDAELAERNSRIARLKATTTEALVGMQEPAVAALLGYPRFVREEALARVWQYNAGECVLDLFLYPAITTPADYEVVHVEARHRKIIAPVSLQDCFGGLVQTQVSALMTQG
ncbi:MAG: hypothetical protein NXI16_18260 [Alphaproteobacteria bacterium]|nr:hypothetical protein [Alphaproteobacteria bacterium]